MTDLETLKMLKGLQTIETIQKITNLSRGSSLNLVSRLKKEGYLSKRGGAHQKRIYKITTLKQRTYPNEGMFGLINKYSKLKLRPHFRHIVHGAYAEEDALIDAVKLRSFRVILASLRLFNHIKDWKKLYTLSELNKIEPVVGALYDLARKNFRVRKMPRKYYKLLLRKAKKKVHLLDIKSNDFIDLEKKWKVTIPFSKKDLDELK